MDANCFHIEWDVENDGTESIVRFHIKEEGLYCLSAKLAFEALAAEAGLEIDPDSDNPVGLWIVHLRMRFPGIVASTTTHRGSDDAERRWTTKYIDNLGLASSILCRDYQLRDMKTEQEERQLRASEYIIESDEPQPAPSPQDWSVETTVAGEEQRQLKDAYLCRFPEVVILDICWAAGQRYREWTRWISGKSKADSKPDRAFRGILTSEKRPLEYRSEPRPKGWK